MKMRKGVRRSEVKMAAKDKHKFKSKLLIWDCALAHEDEKGREGILELKMAANDKYNF